VTIRFQASTGAMDAIRSVIDSRSAIGGGFLCFSASSTGGSRQESQSMYSKMEGNTISIAIPGPQTLGWFIETMQEDKSTPLVDTPAPAGAELNIVQFVKLIRSIASPSTPGTAAAPADREATAVMTAAALAKAKSMA